MQTKLKYIICGTLMACALVTAQDKKTKKAKARFESHSYAPAIESYEDLVDQGYSDAEIYMNLGDAHYQNANYTEAANWYSKLFTREDATIDADYMYRYAQALKSSKEYSASAIWMQKYQIAKTKDVRAKKIAANPDFMTKIENNSGRYEIKPFDQNSAESDFAPAFKGEQLVFSSARDSGTVARNIHTWNNKSFTNLYAATVTGATFSTPSKLTSLNRKTHETSAVFTKDGTTVYFTRNNSDNGSFSRDKDGVSRLKIYRAKLHNGDWTDITELSFNSDDYSSAHPALSPDERKLYFASNREGTIGSSDIFVVDINEDGSMGTPKNLGSAINTEARETFPFVSASNALYFASDGHPGLGGLDVFATKIDDLNDLYIVNVGAAVNSEHDDFSFIIDEDTHMGFFASNRTGGMGSDDIYAFTETEEIDLTCNTIVQGRVTDKTDGTPLGGAKVALYNEADALLAETIAGADGSFTLEGDCKDGEYRIVASKEEYDSGDTLFAVVNANDTSGVELNLERSLKRAAAGTDLVRFLSLQPVYFDLDKADIRADASATILKIIEYMNLYPDIRIQVQSHTDAKASKRYNDRLSQRRADNTVAYLIANKMNSARVSGKGLGETKLVNDCTDWSKCSPEQNEENRRSEFIVLQ